MFSLIKRITLLTLLLVLSAINLSAQEESEGMSLLSPAYQYSKKKTSYVTLADGTQVSGVVKDFDWKKNQIEYIKLKGNDGKTYKLDADEIKNAYFQPSALSKLSSMYDGLKVQRWANGLNSEFIRDGYVYLETVQVRQKKKVRTLLMQLLNPHFSEGIKVYNDPRAKETMSLGVGPVTVAGGLEKSYYVKKDSEEIAVLLKKKDYKEEFAAYFGDCPEVMNAEKKAWRDFATHIYTFASTCAKK